MKKSLAIFFMLILLVQINFVAFATNVVTVSADATYLTQEQLTLISIKIKNNSGLMGFKITVEYPTDKIDIRSVSRGDFTSVGNFSTNFGINDGKFDVLWNNTNEVKEDGTLFIVSAQLKTEIKEEVTIKLSFSQHDTFNEKYEDVYIECNSIVISSNYIEPSTEESSTQSDNTLNNQLFINNSQVLETIRTTLEQNNVDSLGKVTSKDDFVQGFNKNLEMITGTNAHNVTSFETIISMYNSAYEGEFIKEVSNNVDSYKIQDAVGNALKDCNAQSIDKLQNKDKATFIENVEKNLKQYDNEIPSISTELDTEAALDIIGKLYNAQDTHVSETESSKNIFYIVLAVIILVIIISILVCCKKQRFNQRREKDEKQL